VVVVVEVGGTVVDVVVGTVVAGTEVIVVVDAGREVEGVAV
jgi:hypothetical protein